MLFIAAVWNSLGKKGKITEMRGFRPVFFMRLGAGGGVGRGGEMGWVAKEILWWGYLIVF